MSGYEIVGDDYDDDDGEIGYEIVGEDDDLLDAMAVSGDGMSEIIGARKRGRRPKARLVRRIASKNAKAVMRRSPNRSRRYPLGFVPTAVAAGAAASIPAGPQNLFRAERLVIPSDIAFDFGVTDIKVGNQSQLVQNVQVPAAVFSEVAIDTEVTFDTAEVGNQISIDVVNNNVLNLTFRAAMLGSIAK